MAKPLRITVGGNGPYDPAAGQRDVNLPHLKGVDFYVAAPGYGPIPYDSYSYLTSGGFRLATNLEDENVYWIYETGLLYNGGGVTASTNYTNGFNYTRVMSSLIGRIGWLQTPDIPVLDITNLTSKSNRKFNDGSFHNLVSLETIKNLMEQVNTLDVDFNAYLLNLQKAIILRALCGVFNEPEYIDQSIFYDRESYGNNDQVLPNEGKFVGIQILTPTAIDIAVQIDSIGLYFDSVKTFNLYLFNDVKKQPIFTLEVTTEANTQTIVELPDVILNYIGNANHGGVFYIGYFQDDLGDTKAIWETDICFKYNKPYGAVTIEADKTESVDFDRKLISYTSRSNGLNPHISVFRDHTWQIIKKVSLFDNLIGMQMAAQVIEMMLFSQRSNKVEREVKDRMDSVQISMELTGTAPVSDAPRSTGLRKQIDQELNRVKNAFLPKQKIGSYPIC
jgi:hypothetical protein